jgi:ABC-type bacteriocin/lantibiotic exporter with double-glycine peptidase domain
VKRNIKDRIKCKSVLQHDSSDCGAACLLSVIRYYGGNSTIETIRLLSGTTQSGTTMLGLYQAANKCGLEAAGYEASMEAIINYKNALILHVRNQENHDHYIVSFGFEHNEFLIWDPSQGLIMMTTENLEKIWFSKKCLGLIPNKDFSLETVGNKTKQRWLISVLKPERDLLFISAIIGIIVSALGLVMAIYTQKLIDKVIPNGNFSYLLLTSFLVFILLSSRIVLASVRQLLLLTQGKAFNIRVVNDFYGSLFLLPKVFFDTRKTGDFVARLNDTMRIQRVLADIIGTYLIDILIIAATLTTLLYYSSGVLIISLVCLPVFYLVVSSKNLKLKSLQNSLMAGYSLSESNFIDSLKGIEEIKSLNWNDTYINKSNFFYTDYQNRILQLGKMKVKLNLTAGLFGSFYLILVLVFASVEVIRLQMTQGELMAILSLSSTLLPSIINIALIGIPISEAKVALNRMFEFTQIKPEEIVAQKRHLQISIDQLKIDNISFRYPGQSLLLDNISLRVSKGEVISIIGESGCGKSTLANIILRFYKSEAGRILINNGIDSDEIGMKDWRAKIGLIPQEIHIFNGTILQNLVTDFSEVNINRMISKISDLGLSGFINKLPNGLMTLVGEEGINLSGGQKQLLSYIRVLLNNPDILIIDEGTSNLDIRTEGIVIDLLSRLKRNIGIIMITHRLNLVKALSDSIYVFNEKSLINMGNHNALMMSDNYYRKYWDNFN